MDQKPLTLTFEPTPVPVSFLLTGEADTTRAAEELGEFVGALAVKIGIPSEVIERVVVADTARYGDALAQFEGKREFTNSHGLLAVGKTIKVKGPKPVRSVIILNVAIVGAVLNAGRTKGWSVAQWSQEEQHSFYVIAHEIGHCADHLLREDIEDDGTWRDESGHRVTDAKFANIHAYQFSMVYPEIAACAISGANYTAEMRFVDAAMSNASFLSMLQELETMTAADSRDLAEICRQVGAVFWFVLFQHGKFVGSQIGNAKLEKALPSELWTIAKVIPEVGDALTRAETAIIEAWNRYPQAPPELRTELTDCFHVLCRACGYSLEERGGQEGVWWNTFKRFTVRLLLERSR